MSDKPQTIEEVQEAVRAGAKIVPRGGGTKPALSAAQDGQVLDLAALSGVLEYDPNEFTFTALAGTPVREVEALLKENGQYLPFDPPFSQRGATLGGTVAAGLSGPGRNRYGGVRDFILGVRFVDGSGEVIRGGGKVVKNAAGFDLPKLMVGSLGRFGILTELSFKVFPEPKAYTTLSVDFENLEDALISLVKLSTSPFDLEALELEVPAKLTVRLGGLPEALPDRIKRLEDFLGRSGQVLTGEEESDLWQEVKEFSWLPKGFMLVKAPLTPRRIPKLDKYLEEAGARRRYSTSGNVAWIGWPGERDGLDSLLTSHGLCGLVLIGPPGGPLIGTVTGRPLAKRIKKALDPESRFLEV